MLWSPVALGTRMLLWFGRAGSGNRTRLEHERSHGLGMDARGIVCAEELTLLGFGHGCARNPDCSRMD